jgi:hypothetical protein
MSDTQLTKIINLCRDGHFHCQAQFWPISKSPHKRRSDIEAMGEWKFESRKCQHGIVNSHDFRMYSAKTGAIRKIEIVTMPNGERRAVERII